MQPARLGETELAEKAVPRLLPVCGNERCRTTWLRLWRRRQTPRFEGFWACSTLCLEEMIRVAVGRESDFGGGNAADRHEHRVPLGLMLYSQGAITQDQLRAALAAQRSDSKGGDGRRIGRWLIQQRSLDEAQLTRALSLQWNCPVFAAERFEAAQAAPLLPRLLVESCGALPLRRTSSGRILVAFEDQIDHRVSLAIERIHGLPVEAGIMAPSGFRHAREQLVAARAPKLRLLEVANASVMVRAMVKRIEDFQPLEARMVRLREYYWLRMWKGLDVESSGMEDLLVTHAQFS